MRKQGYDGKTFMLQDMYGNEVSDHGGLYFDNRGKAFEVRGGNAPHKPSSTGSVYGSWYDETVTTEYFPSVFGLSWVVVSG